MTSPILIAILLVGIASILVLIAAIRAGRNRRFDKKETDYKAFFVMGLCFLPLGITLSITTKNPGLMGITALGAVYMWMGFSNKDKWEKTKKKRKK